MLKQKKDETREFETLILEAVKAESSAFIWDICGDEVIRVPVELKNFNSYKKKINFTLDHRAKYYLKDLIKGPGLLKFYIPNQHLLFVSKIDLYRGTQLEVCYPDMFKKHDRRRDDRVEPLIPVFFKSDGLKKECYDLSHGGFSFVMNNMEYRKVKYKIDKELECQIEFPFKKVKVAVKVVNVANIKLFQLDRFPYGAKRVSFQIIEGDFFKESVTKLAKGMKKLLIDLL